MKTLILFRHGKSDWSGGTENDHDRPVSKRGRTAAQVMGRFLTLARQVPRPLGPERQWSWLLKLEIGNAPCGSPERFTKPPRL